MTAFSCLTRLGARRTKVAGACLLVLPLLGMFPACGGDLPPTAIDSTNAGQAGNLTASTPLSEGRSLHTATLLQDGRVLIVGGGTPESPVASAEILDPASGTTLVVASIVPRLGHTATLLPNGQVLIAGGGYGATQPAARSAELFDPATNTFTSAGNLSEARADHAAILLRTGAVLILGGDVSGVGTSATAAAELYDPAARRFTPISPMNVPRRPSGVIMLPDGRVLVPGGTTTGKRVLASAELYDPQTGTFTPTGELTVPREKHTAALASDGRVLIAGGSRGPADSDRLASTSWYEAATGRFVPGPSMRVARHKVSSVALADGSILVVGGGAELAEIYLASSGTFASIRGAAAIERFFPATTTLNDGSVLISGGYTSGGSRTTTWRYRP